MTCLNSIHHSSRNLIQSHVAICIHHHSTSKIIALSAPCGPGYSLIISPVFFWQTWHTPSRHLLTSSLNIVLDNLSSSFLVSICSNLFSILFSIFSLLLSSFCTFFSSFAISASRLLSFSACCSNSFILLLDISLNILTLLDKCNEVWSCWGMSVDSANG